MKYIILFFLFFFQLLTAQYSVEGTFVDSFPKVKKVALYQLINGTPEYLTYVSVEKNKFTFSMDSESTGDYRVLYKNTPSGYVDFIYNQEDVLFTVDSKRGATSVEYLESRENQLLTAYQYYIALLQKHLYNIQMSFLGNSKVDVNTYKEVQSKIESAQNYYENLAKSDYCLHRIKASKQYNSSSPLNSIEEYRESVLNHFFDFIDFNNIHLKNSNFLQQKVSEYVFSLHQSENKEIEDKLIINAISRIDTLFEVSKVKEMVLQNLLLQSVSKEKNKVVEYTLSIYKKLPQEYQKLELIEEVERVSKTLLGVIAPNITISKKETLYSLSDSDEYLIVFWSSTCSHCSLELPKIKDYLKGKNNITVVAVGLEELENKEEWSKEIKKYPSWKNVYAKYKWKNINAVNYNVHSTPSYFLLNREKTIIAKPNSLEKIKRLLN